MDYKYYYTKDGEPYKVVFYPDKHDLDTMLDQMLLGKFNIISEDEFNEITKDIKLVTLEIHNEFTDEKIGELTTSELGFDVKLTG